MNFSIRLKQLRQKNKMTQSDLAKVLGLKPTAISNYESERNEPSFDKLIALSKFFDVTIDYLLGISDTYLPVGGEVLDRDIVEFYDLYQQLTPESELELKRFAEYLLYKQRNQTINGKEN
ncbi:MAG: helix-turn-helix transcriptional regulator [Lachnospiraceae bacterium]|jgi:transcriptional regulator with XRE-family HTH domain|nr:helix-turn-helix transcriptional regulator [Lachnospiraceae bacterium]